MLTTYHQNRLTTVKRLHSFTLLELVVVIVVVSVLAALAVPTFNAVKDKVVDSNATTTLAALVREAGMLASFRGDTVFTPSDFAEATADLPALTLGAQASGPWTVSTTPQGTSQSEHSIHLTLSGSPTGRLAGLATLTATGNCALALADGVSAAPTVWSQPVSPSVPCGGDIALAGPPESPSSLAATLNLVATPGDHKITIGYTPAPQSTSTVLSRHETDSGPVVETVEIDNDDCDPGCSLDFPGLLPAKTYQVTAYAKNGTEQSNEASVSSTPTGSMAWIAALGNGDFTSHPFTDWTSGLALYTSLLATPGVSSVEYNFPLMGAGATLPAGTPVVKNQSSDALREHQWALDQMRFEDVWCASDGTGATIALIDANIDDIAEFGSQMTSPPGDFPLGHADPSEISHGVSTASVIIAQPNATGIVGAAPGAEIVPYNAPNGGLIDAIKARKAWEQANNNSSVDVINLSFNTSVGKGVWNWVAETAPLVEAPTEVFKSLAEDSANAGKVVVAASGHTDDPDGGGTSTDQYPAVFPSVIAVGITNSDGTVLKASNRGSYLDLGAPGGFGVGATAPTGGRLGIQAITAVNGTVKNVWGNSYSAPYVSALAAIIKSLHPSMTPAQVFDAMKVGVRDVGPSGKDDFVGWGYPDAVDTLAALGDVPPGGCSGPIRNFDDMNQASGSSTTNARGMFSDDGSKAVLATSRTDLTPADTTSDTDILVRSMSSGQYTLVTTGQDGAPASGSSPSISGNGTKVSYLSGSGPDLYVYDLQSGDTTVVMSYVWGVSPGVFSGDGSKIAFGTGGVPPGITGDTNASDDIYVYNIPSGTYYRASTTSAGTQGKSNTGHDCAVHDFSEDGNHVLFACGYTNPSLVLPDANGTVYDLYVKNLSSGALTRVNESSDGTQSSAAGSSASISADGSTVVFASTDPSLVPGDTNGLVDVFFKDVSSGAITRLTGPSGSQLVGGADYPSVSPQNPDLVAFSTASSLSAGDTGYWDIYTKDMSTDKFTWVSERGGSIAWYPYPRNGIYQVQFAGDRVLFRLRYYSVYYLFYRDM